MAAIYQRSYKGQFGVHGRISTTPSGRCRAVTGTWCIFPTIFTTLKNPVHLVFVRIICPAEKTGNGIGCWSATGVMIAINSTTSRPGTTISRGGIPTRDGRSAAPSNRLICHTWPMNWKPTAGWEADRIQTAPPVLNKYSPK